MLSLAIHLPSVSEILMFKICILELKFMDITNGKFLLDQHFHQYRCTFKETFPGLLSGLISKSVF